MGGRAHLKNEESAFLPCREVSTAQNLFQVLLRPEVHSAQIFYPKHQLSNSHVQCLPPTTRECRR